MQKKFKLSESGYQFLLSVEEYRTKPISDSTGQLCVGIHHVGKDIIPNKIYTDEEIDEFFQKDKSAIEEDVNKIFDSRFMTQNMFDACFSFAFNVGNISQTELGKMIAKNPYDDRLREFWAYTYTNGKKNQKLVNRR